MITKTNLTYSLNNVPVPTKNEYMKGIISATETFIQNLRWKVIHLLKDDTKPKKEKINYYGFKTPNNAKNVPLLDEFEADMSHLVSNLEFHENKKPTPLQSKLNKDIKKIKSSKNLFVKADKSSNVYEVDVETYKKHLTDNITANYKKAKTETQTEINEKAKEITDELKISDRVEMPPIKECYITLKDHKPNFPAKVECRLINPAKSNIGRISKKILDNINRKIQMESQLQQLKNTEEALQWFSNIKDKKNSLLLTCDIDSFYPSISKSLVHDAIEFAEEYTNITEIEKKVLMNARESLLHHDGEIWMKKDGTFDVTMGAYDGAQISDLVGLLILSKVKQQIPELNFALYRDDGIASHRKMRPDAIDRIRKKLESIFKNLGLSIKVETTRTSVDFLDVTLNIFENSYQPFKKPNNTPLYIHKDSNHPPHVIRNVPKAVNKRLATISSSEELFKLHKNEYQHALSKSGFTHSLQYKHPCVNKRKYSNSNRIQTEAATSTMAETTASQPNPTTQPIDANQNDQPINNLPANRVNRPAHPTQTPPTSIQNRAVTNPAPPIRKTRSHTARARHTSPRPPSSAPPTIARSTENSTSLRRSQRIKDKCTNNHETNNSNKQPNPAKPLSTPSISQTLNPNNTAQQPPSWASTPNPQKSNESTPGKNKNRKRNVVFWNPPFNINLKTNIGKQFLALINKHFPSNCELSSSLNRHTIKLAYATTSNMSQIIAAHNAKVLRAQKPEEPPLPCNCRRECPLSGSPGCRAKQVIYKAEIKGSIYIGQTQTPFRERASRHRTSFKYESKKYETSLSKFIWDKKHNMSDGQIVEPDIKWSIMRNCNLYKPGDRVCNLCSSEKILILLNMKSPKCLNKKTDLSNKCNHKKDAYYSAMSKDEDENQISDEAIT